MSTAEVDLGGSNLLIRLVVLDMVVYLVSQLVFYVLPAPVLTNMSVISWHFAASMATTAFRFLSRSLSAPSVILGCRSHSIFQECTTTGAGGG